MSLFYCPGCHTWEFEDRCCKCCGHILTAGEMVAQRREWPPFPTKLLEDEKLDLALRSDQ